MRRRRGRRTALAATAALAAAVAVHASYAQPPRNVGKSFDVRISIVGTYRFTANATVPQGNCTVAFNGSGGGDARFAGRDAFHYQRYSSPRGERISARLPRPTGTLSLNRFGQLHATTTCPREPGATTRNAPAVGCRRIGRPVAVESGVSGARTRPMWLVLNPKSDVGALFSGSEPCPPTHGPHGINFTASSSFPWGGVVVESDPKLRIRERELLRKRFIRRTWSVVVDAPLVARDLGRATVGTQRTEWRMRVLFCARSAGGCGRRSA